MRPFCSHSIEGTGGSLERGTERSSTVPRLPSQAGVFNRGVSFGRGSNFGHNYDYSGGRVAQQFLVSQAVVHKAMGNMSNQKYKSLRSTINIVINPPSTATLFEHNHVRQHPDLITATWA
jgi:hypothetical protein